MPTLKKRSNQQIFGFIKKMVSGLLLCAIFSTTALQILHQHQGVLKAETSSKHIYQKAAANCKLCECLLHQKSKEYLSPSPLSLTFYEQLAYTRTPSGSQSKRSSASLSIPNKGPPAPLG